MGAVLFSFPARVLSVFLSFYTFVLHFYGNVSWGDHVFTFVGMVLFTGVGLWWAAWSVGDVRRVGHTTSGVEVLTTSVMRGTGSKRPNNTVNNTSFMGILFSRFLICSPRGPH